MGISKPTASFVFDTRRILKNGKYPVKLRVYFNGNSKLYKLPFSFSEVEWAKLNNPKLRSVDLKETKVKLNYFKDKKFEDALKKMDSAFNFDTFKKVYFGNVSKFKLTTNVYDLFDQYIKLLSDSGQVGTAQVYSTAKKSFANFKKSMTFNDVSPKLLKEYESYMQKEGRSDNYISMNLRCMRSIYNQAIGKNIVSMNDYPFSKSQNDGKFKIRKGHSNKRALDISQLKILKTYKPTSPAQKKAFLFWWFSFYCSGINAKDIAMLKFKNIHENKVVFTRSKIRDMTNAEPIQFHISDTVRNIIEELRNQNSSPDNYLFEILKPGLTALQIRNKVQSFSRNINKHFKKISQELKFPFSITTYHARHSFASYLKQKDVSIGIISEMLGHTSQDTTKSYLKSFHDEVLEDISRKLDEI